MRPKTEYHDARRLMIALHRREDDGPVVTEGLSEKERQFGKMSAMAVVMAYELSFVTGFDAEHAKDGLRRLVGDMEKHIEGICEL